jgi:hypothetical protein
MGSGGKGKGQGTANQVAIPPGMMTTAENLGNIGSYESQFLNVPYSLGNWASNIATGGTGPQATSPAGTAGPGTGYFGPGINQTTGDQFPYLDLQNYGSGGGSGGTGSGTGVGSGGGGGPNPFTGYSSTGYGTTTGLPGWLSNFQSALDTEQNMVAGQGNAPNAYKNASENYREDVQDINSLNSSILGNIGQSQNQSNAFFNQANTMLGPNGITPEQNAWINQSTQAAQEQTAQQFGSEGLSGSTMAAEQAGEIGLQGAAEKGQLQQQNIALQEQEQQIGLNQEQLTQNWQNLYGKLAVGEQGLDQTDQQMLFNMTSQIGNQSTAEQNTMFDQALQGYGLMGTFMNAVTQPYGLQVQDFGDILGAETAQMQSETGLMESENQQASQGSSSLMSGLASIVGAVLLA